MLLYVQKSRTQRFDCLSAIGAPREPGIYETDADWRDVLRLIVAHRLALVDPVAWPLLPVLHWALARDPATGAYCGPYVYFAPAALEVPQVAAGGLPLGEVIARYLAAAPIAVPPVTGRIAVRSILQAAPLWRRVVPAPPPRLNPIELQAWMAWQRALPMPERMVRWYQATRQEQWRRLALRRLLEDLAAGRIVGWHGAEPIPPTWWESHVELDLGAGDLFGAGPDGARLATSIRVYRAGDMPAAVTARHEHWSIGSAAAVDAFIARHRAQLAVIAHRGQQIEYVRARLRASHPLIRQRLATAFGVMVGAQKRRREAA